MKSFEIHDAVDHITESAVSRSASTKVPSGAVLVVTRSGILRHSLPVAVAAREVALNQDLKGLIPAEGLNSKFVAYSIRAFAQLILHTCSKSGTTVESIEFPSFKEFEIPVAPMREQVRIADALDELLSDLDASVASLERALARLKLFRASVLKSAVDGSLTADWRERHPDVEPASVLLERILAERRHRWEEERLEAFHRKQRVPPPGWKSKYRKPVQRPVADPVYPDGWARACVDYVVWSLRTGNSESSGREVTEHPILKSSAVRQGTINFDERNYLQPSQCANAANFLRLGDFLVTRLSGSVEYVGCAAVVTYVPVERIQYPDRIFRARLVDGIDPLFLTYCFQHPRARGILEEAAKSTAGHKRISVPDVTSLPIPLPPLAEQEAIVEIAEEQLSLVDHLESELAAKLKSAGSLRQAILRHAFTGQLVPQDPNDEPASVLLARIAAERATQGRPPRATRAAPRRPSARRQR